MDETESIVATQGKAKRECCVEIEEAIKENKFSEVRPCVGMEFDSHEEAYHFYNCYAGHIGFSVRKNTTNRSKITNEIIGRVFCCSLQGLRDSRAKPIEERLRDRADTRTDCKAMMTVRKKKENGKWFISKVIEEHNHEFVTPSKRHNLRSYRKSQEKIPTNINVQVAGIRTNLMMNFMASEVGGIRKAVEKIDVSKSSLGAGDTGETLEEGMRSTNVEVVAETTRGGEVVDNVTKHALLETSSGLGKRSLEDTEENATKMIRIFAEDKLTPCSDEGSMALGGNETGVGGSSGAPKAASAKQTEIFVDSLKTGQACMTYLGSLFASMEAEFASVRNEVENERRRKDEEVGVKETALDTSDIELHGVKKKLEEVEKTLESEREAHRFELRKKEARIEELTKQVEYLAGRGRSSS